MFHATKMKRIVVSLERDEKVAKPAYQTSESAGADLLSNSEEPIILQPGKRVLVPTGLRIMLPVGYEAQIRPRSGLALKHGITVLNAPGTIDSDYRGEVGVILINHGETPFTINLGDKIAQMVIAPVVHANCFTVMDRVRGDGGFGSTTDNKSVEVETPQPDDEEIKQHAYHC